jgi:predicted DNA-binding transcriptional regulator AlpA
MTRRLLSPRTTADFLQLEPATLGRWMAEGFGPIWYRVGESVLFSEASVLRWKELLQQPADPDRLLAVSELDLIELKHHQQLPQPTHTPPLSSRREPSEPC